MDLSIYMYNNELFIYSKTHRKNIIENVSIKQFTWVMYLSLYMREQSPSWSHPDIIQFILTLAE